MIPAGVQVFVALEPVDLRCKCPVVAVRIVGGARGLAGGVVVASSP